MNRIVKILIKRDGMTEEDAKDLVADVKEQIGDALEYGDFDLVEEIMISELGLEMDYIDDILGVLI